MPRILAMVHRDSLKLTNSVVISHKYYPSMLMSKNFVKETTEKNSYLVQGSD